MKLQSTVKTRLLETYRGLNEFKKGYEPRAKLMKDENFDLLLGYHNVSNRWKYYFSQVLGVHGVKEEKTYKLKLTLVMSLI